MPTKPKRGLFPEPCKNCNVSKVDSGEMVDGLDMQKSSRRSLKTTLKKFLKLFGGGLGKLDMKPAVSISLKEGLKPY